MTQWNLKDVKTAGGQESVRFEADLCFGEKQVAVVYNDGCGGPHMIEWDNPEDRSAFWDWLKTSEFGTGSQSDYSAIRRAELLFVRSELNAEFSKHKEEMAKDKADAIAYFNQDNRTEFQILLAKLESLKNNISALDCSDDDKLMLLRGALLKVLDINPDNIISDEERIKKEEEEANFQDDDDWDDEEIIILSR